MLFTERGRKASQFLFQIVAAITILGMIALTAIGLFR
jgi:hypothetical protein